jgi:7,8-dihydropterin-6-yl-methyl-4-(beta-D-ribofuranosyl)aminobenzene 5'-phosphate synthase
MPRWFSDVFKQEMDVSGLKPLLVDEPALICPHLYTSGAFDHIIPEQALVLDTRDGLVVLTGCSHPGVVEMLRAIKAAFRKSEPEMRAIIADLQALGVVRCGATHCTGDIQIGMINRAFGANYVELGVGNALVLK